MTNENSASTHTAIKLGKAMLCKEDRGEPFVLIEASRVDRISEFSE
jgi:hypothetical protein